MPELMTLKKSPAYNTEYMCPHCGGHYFSLREMKFRHKNFWKRLFDIAPKVTDNEYTSDPGEYIAEYRCKGTCHGYYTYIYDKDDNEWKLEGFSK